MHLNRSRCKPLNKPFKTTHQIITINLHRLTQRPQKHKLTPPNHNIIKILLHNSTPPLKNNLIRHDSPNNLLKPRTNLIIHKSPLVNLLHIKQQIFPTILKLVINPLPNHKS